MRAPRPLGCRSQKWNPPGVVTWVGLSVQSRKSQVIEFMVSIYQAVPASRHLEDAGTTGAGRHNRLYGWGATALTWAHTALLNRRDGNAVLWCLPIAVLAAFLTR